MKMELKDKILQYFEGKVVRKDLTSKIKEWIKWSNHVLEYLLGQYCAVDDQAIIEDGIEKSKALLRIIMFIEVKQWLRLIFVISKNKIIDKVNVSLNDRASI
jgi:ATP-dependent Lon protease